MKKVKQIGALLLLTFLGLGFQSCRDQKTYAEMKEDEKNAIQAFLTKNGFSVISEDAFLRNDTMTKANEFVELAQTGIYMNIVNRGPGKALTDGNHTLICRYVEMAVQTRDELGMVAGDTLLANMHITNVAQINNTLFPEYVHLTKQGTSLSASLETNSLYYAKYESTAVPSGWLVPLNYLKVGRTQKSDEVARVRIIIPHSEGPATASNYVYPLYYEITYNL